MFKALLKTMRPRQWTKNAFVFASLVFDGKLFHPIDFLRTLAGFGLFCIVSSAIYIFNDIIDLETDQLHPVKRNRPIASGKLPVPFAICAGILLTLGALVAGYLLAWQYALVLLIYVILMLFYSRWLKHIPILDVMILATGFVLRVHAGSTLITIDRFSPWLYVIMTLLALSLGFGKRRAELTLLLESGAAHSGNETFRKVLDGYTIPLLDQFINIVSGTTIVAYSLYTFFRPDAPSNHSLMLSIPFVVYAVFRYLYLIQVEHCGGEPEEILLTDRPFQVALALWGFTILAVFYLS
jgi:4-hydroxybenzoate polyprenyltransferase